ILRSNLGGVMDVEAKGDVAFAAVTKLDWPWVPCTMLGRVRVVGGALVDEPLVTNPGSSAGNALDIDSDFLCFGTWSPGRYEGGKYNLWAFTHLLDDTPTRVGAGGTLDWIFQLACRDSAGSDWIYVADEWGGLEMWESNGLTLTLDLDRHRVNTGMFSLGMWVDGSKVYSVREGSGLWVFDEAAPHEERVAVEWINHSDPGCACAGCCPPEVGAWPYPPAVFVSAGTSNQGRVVLLAQDRNTAVPSASYLMFFQDTISHTYECAYSVPITSTSGNMVMVISPEILCATTAAHALRVYQHCPAEADPVRFLGEAAMPTQGADLYIVDAAAYGDYLFVAEVHQALLSEPDSGAIHVYRWKQGDLATCPAQPAPLSPAYLGSFGTDLIPRRLLVDPARNLLLVGATSKKTFPIKEGALLFYDLGSFDPGNPAGLDALRTFHSPPETMRVTYSSIYDLLVSDDALYVADVDNGLYKYSFSRGVYVGFYPAQRGTASQGYVPQMVLAPAGVVPLYLPIAVALTPSGKVVVQEHMTGRVSVLVESRQVYLPLVKR
ncbi:MAG: hypothetical protein KJ734_05720, partial [Chloroflexi bacterium]|nr:hypothetical protein [Chloroflexota bacterium]